jgi:protein SCO1/2
MKLTGVLDRQAASPSWRRTACAVALAAACCAGCGSSSDGSAPSAAGARLSGLILRPARPAPPLALHDYTGRGVSIAAFRGKAVLVTFVYTHCPNVCPLIVSDLAVAQRGLGKRASRVRIVAVTVDPRRDTRAAVRTFLAARGATGRMYYLLGKRSQLERVWKAWDVSVSAGVHGYTTGHSDIVYGITASGRVAVVYPANFTPAQIIHDVPLLARS